MRTLPLARSVVDSAAHRRTEPDAVAGALRDPSTRVVVVRSGLLATVTVDGGIALDLLRPAEVVRLGIGGEGVESEPFLFLGEHGGVTYLAAVLPGPPAPAGNGVDPADADGAPAVVRPGGAWSSLREIGSLLCDRDADLATTAVALGEWHRRSPRCTRCGSPTRPALAGWVRHCLVDGFEEYPRTDAAVIVAITDERDRMLLGHNAAWTDPRFSTLAGYVEPGESLETAVRREVGEEVGVTVVDVTYAGSQPWPFPAALMVAFRARATTTDIVVDAHELTDARWFTRGELHRAVRDGDVTLPTRASVALALIEEWYGGPVDGTPEGVGCD